MGSSLAAFFLGSHIVDRLLEWLEPRDLSLQVSSFLDCFLPFVKLLEDGVCPGRRQDVFVLFVFEMATNASI
jgi:hypothetical protein